MKRAILLILILVLGLSGCTGWMDGSYASTMPHQDQTPSAENQIAEVKNYSELCQALGSMAEKGVESAVLSVADYENTHIKSDLNEAIVEVRKSNPIAAYAVEKIEYELGTNVGQPAVALAITYIHDRDELLKIRRVANVDEAQKVVAGYLDNCAAATVLYLDNYEAVDFVQIVEDYALNYPQRVMEIPSVTVNVYPETGTERVVELKYSYQSNREALRNMKDQVSNVFESAVLYVSGDAAEREKFSQLYSFLMERYEYQLGTSITPAYSLLRHGVGDAKAFAVVYAAMCREAGLDCGIISGTRKGEPWVWNVVYDEGNYYYVDLLRCSASGAFQERTEKEMGDYVWDYSASPSCSEN